MQYLRQQSESLFCFSHGITLGKAIGTDFLMITENYNSPREKAILANLPQKV